MSTRMLIDTRHSEETRVAIVKGSRVEDFDYESVAKKQLKGNIYLARVTRVEPSLQACFVEYGGNRHGFLAFSEIHPDYYQIPAEDREALLAEGDEYADMLDEEYAADGQDQTDDQNTDQTDVIDVTAKEVQSDDTSSASDNAPDNIADDTSETDHVTSSADTVSTTSDASETSEEVTEADNAETSDQSDAEPENGEPADGEGGKTIGEDVNEDAVVEGDVTEVSDDQSADDVEEITPNEATVEEVDTDTEAENINDDEEDDSDPEMDATEARELRKRRYFLRTVKRRYKIQEVIKRRQVLLIQVVKEERGNKGAALTTYLSLAGRYCVLMPNSTHSGGISRKISSHNDRRRLKGIINSLRMPHDMGLILRTAGMKRTKVEIKRDYDYLLRMWNAIRELTLKSVAPALIYEEGNLIKRTIRDLYNRDIDEILVEGRGYRQAKDFMKMLMPSHAAKVKNYTNRIPLFHRYQVEGQLASMYDPVVQLKSGGYIVINPTEALISIDVNSGRATKEKSIEETAVKTNVEAAEEVARQLRLRDMAGLVVIDFIDMEDRNNIRTVERRMKEELRHDRARIQVGKISSFGLMEMSRQRLRPNLLEAAMHECPHCKGSGVVPTVESAALTVLRELEEEGIRSRSSVIRITLQHDVAAYILNNKRRQLLDLEYLYKYRIEISSRADFGPSQMEIEREAMKQDSDKGTAMTADEIVSPVSFDMDDTSEDNQSDDGQASSRQSGQEQKSDHKQQDDTSDDKRKKRRRRRRRRGQDQDERSDRTEENTSSDSNDQEEGNSTPSTPEAEDDRDDKSSRRRRGRRGGRRRRKQDGDDVQSTEQQQATDAPQSDDQAASSDGDTPTQVKSDDQDTINPDEKSDRKPRRRGRPSKKRDQDSSEGKNTAQSEDQPSNQQADADQSSEQSAEEKKPVRKRRPRKPRTDKTSEKGADTADKHEGKAVEASASTDTAAEEAKPKRKPAAKKKADDHSPAENTAPAQPKTDASAEATKAEPADKPAQPKRKGWWQRTFG